MECTVAAEPDSRRRCDCQEGMVEQVGEEGYPRFELHYTEL